MSYRNKSQGLPLASWPLEDQRLWSLKMESRPFTKGGRRNRLSSVTVRGRRYSYGLFLAFLKARYPHLLRASLTDRLVDEVIESFVKELGKTCRGTTIVIHLERLFFVARSLAPTVDFHWIYKAARSLAAEAPRLVHPIIFSSQLYQIGLEGLDHAGDADINPKYLRQERAFRDSLIVALLAEAPMRRGSLAGILLSDLVKVDDVWQVYARAENAKTRKPAEYELSPLLSRRVDYYLEKICPRFPGADSHDGLWPSLRKCTLRGNSIGRIVGGFTTSRLGTHVSPHAFRRAAAATIAFDGPENVLSIADLLAHSDFRITKQHYMPAAQTRRAGRELARILLTAVENTQ